MTFGGLMHGNKIEKVISYRFILEPPSSFVLLEAMMNNIYASSKGGRRAFKSTFGEAICVF